VRTCLLRNAEETEDHGTVYETRTKKMREQIAAMKEIWTKDKPEHHGEFVSFLPMNLHSAGFPSGLGARRCGARRTVGIRVTRCIRSRTSARRRFLISRVSPKTCLGVEVRRDDRGFL
jgi:hypothetical protein